MIRHLTLAFVFASAAPVYAGGVELKKEGDTVQVSVDGKEFTTYHFGDELPKPFFSPVRTPDGTVISREIGGGGDHPHHKGIWNAVDEVNDVDFWAEKGKIDNVQVDLVQAEGDPAVLHVVNNWLDPNGDVVVVEDTTIRVFANRLLAYDITYRAAAEKEVRFLDTKEGMFGFRMVNSMREREGGTVKNSKGETGTQDCWGDTADWVDYVGPVEGKTCGVAIFDHPLNPRPSRYHVRDYGLFSISPFGESAYTNGTRGADPVIIPPGGEMTWRYAIFFHNGTTDETGVDAVYQDYLARYRETPASE